MISRNISKISQEMEKAVKRSGYLFEQEIANILKKKSFMVTPNYAFRDIETDESREIDVEAFDMKFLGRDKFLETINTYLFVEVKNITPLVCFTQEEVNSRYITGNIQFTGFPENIWTKRNKGTLLEDFLKIEKFHHYYLTNRISSQFCIISDNKRAGKKDPPYIASHHFASNRNLYEELILPLIKVVISEKETLKKNWEFDSRGEPISLHFYYPVAVVNGLFECYIGGKKPSYKKVNRINFIRRYESKKISGDFRIDICDEKGLKELIADIQKDTDDITKKIKRKIKLFRQSAFRDAKSEFQKRKNI
ncbi:MAG: hypothetical protein PHE52_01210 [Candidatus Pacebacteria bacterium]|nr:hypothetical protein [Candidatus Paceibacterota bacterium]